MTVTTRLSSVSTPSLRSPRHHLCLLRREWGTGEWRKRRRAEDCPESDYEQVPDPQPLGTGSGKDLNFCTLYYGPLLCDGTKERPTIRSV